MEMIEAVKEVLWSRDLVINLVLLHEFTIVHLNSQSTIYLIKNWLFHERTKHIDVRYHFILVIISHGVVLVKKIIIVKNLTDILTKPIFIVMFKHCLNLSGLCST